MESSQAEPLVSIVIPCYNHEKYIEESIQSAIEQTYANIELIVIDDGSHDQSVALIEKMREKCESRFVNFKFIARENRGLSKTLNQALGLVEGEFFSVLASDDIMFPEKTITQLNLINHDPEVIAIFTAHQYIDADSQVISIKSSSYKEFTFKDIFFHQHDIPASSQMIRVNELRRLGGYNENTKVEDWDLWLRLTENGAKLVYIPEVLVGYRAHDANLSRDKSLMFDEVFKIVKRYKKSKGYSYAEYKVYKLYKIRPAKEKSYILYLFLRAKYSLTFIWKSIVSKFIVEHK